MAAVSLPALFHVAAILPAIGIPCLSAVYYTTSHYRPGRIRTISEMVNAFPENRFFAVIYTIDAVLIAIALYGRESTIRRSLHVQSGSIYSVFVWTTIPITTLSMAFVSTITLGDSRFWHLLPATFSFVGIILYFIVSDFRAVSSGLKIGRFSRMLPYCSSLAFAIYTYILVFHLWDPFIYSIGSLFQYLMGGLIFSKIYISGSELPDVGFVLLDNKKQE
jgi:uncharacterized membrane protein